MEYRMSQHFMRGHDFFEGVRANLVDKDKTPIWKHNDIFEVKESEFQSYFEPVDRELDVTNYVN
jgi:enoyl-CoA hydratase